jgi:hypothetical protein
MYIYIYIYHIHTHIHIHTGITNAQALEYCPTHIIGLTNYAHLLHFTLGKKPEAEEYYKRAIDQSPDFAPGVYTRTKAHVYVAIDTVLRPWKFIRACLSNSRLCPRKGVCVCVCENLDADMCVTVYFM